MIDDLNHAAPKPEHGALRRMLWPNWAERKRMLKREAWMAVVASYVLFTFAYALPPNYRNDSTGYVVAFWLASLLRMLQFHVGLLIAAIAAVALYHRTWRMAAAAAPLAVLLLFSTLVQYLPKSRHVASGPTVRVMSVNLLMVNPQKEAMAAEIKAADPDVLLFQEYTDEWHQALKKALGEAYPYTDVKRQDDSFGIAIYSKLPFEGEVDQWIHLGRAVTPQMRAVIKIDGQDVAFYNIHLLPPRAPAYESEHRLQFADLLDRLQAETIPYVLAGDFNYPDTAAQHRDMQRIGARETHALAGYGRGATWPVNSFLRYLPGVRIDHLYLSPRLTATRHAVGHGPGSDHRPVTAEVGFIANR